MSGSKILVPIKVEALTVSNASSDDDNWKNFSLNYSTIWGRMGTAMETGDLKELKSNLCEPGIHLHWALPAALTNGIYINGKMVFPAVPNRWLVVRTQLSNGKPITKKWIIESDYVSKTAPRGKSPWVIQEADGSFSDTLIGRAVELKDWGTESKRLASPLTAVGPGNPAFAAIYQSCRSVFGFYDDLKGISSGTFSYLVTGWYSDPVIDPLNKAERAIQDNLRNKWSVNKKKPEDSFPTGTFCHGTLHTVTWDINGTYELPNKKGQVNVGVGYTSIEAKCVQMSKQTGAAEKLLSAFFYDILKDIEGTAQIETEVDNRAFSSVEGGTMWEIQRTEKDKEAKDDKNKKEYDFPDTLKKPGISSLFRDLNREQRNLDRLTEIKKSLLVEYRALCDKIIKDEDGKYTHQLTVQKEQLRNNIGAISGLKETADGQVKDYEQRITSDKSYIKKGDDDNSIKSGFELVSKKMPRFWRPNDPTVLFSGPGVTSSSKYKSPDTSGKLQCRLTSQVTYGIMLRDGDAAEEKTIVVPKDFHLSLTPSGSLSSDHADIINKLFCEALLLDPVWAKEWAFKYYDDETRLNRNAIDLGNYLEKVLNLTKGAENKKFTGIKCIDNTIINEPFKSHDALAKFLEELSIQDGKHPWTPVYMIWYVKWIPSYKTEQGQRIFEQGNWEWKDKKYRYHGPEPDEDYGIEYSGKAILTDAITGILRSRLPGDVKVDPNISQALGSFSDALLMRLQAIQLPLLKVTGTEDDPVLLKDTIDDPYLTNETYFFPHTEPGVDKINDFFPVRAGHFRITRLWVTDAFGQVQKVINEEKKKISMAGSLYIAEHVKSKFKSPLIELAPRIIQPSRLWFRWANASMKEFDESSSDPSTNPVCGWIMPDYLDQCLNIYETSGESCGSLRMIDTTGGYPGNKRLEWNGAPGSAGGATPENSIQNSYLRNFVSALLEVRDKDNRLSGGLTVNLLFDLCNNMARFLNTPSSHQAPGIAGLIGQPVALVRAALKLELLGLPAQPQGWADQLTIGSIAEPPGIKGLEFPVSLGDTRNCKDGLIGYFTDKTGFSKMNLPYGTPGQENTYFTNDDIKLTFKPDEKPAGITLLMDPRGGVQADCGILPSKLIDLPDRFTDKGLKNIEFNILVAPFLGSANDPYIPVGIEPDSNWILRQKTAPGAWKRTKVGNQYKLSVSAGNARKAEEGYFVLRQKRTPGVWKRIKVGSQKQMSVSAFNNQKAQEGYLTLKTVLETGK